MLVNVTIINLLNMLFFIDNYNDKTKGKIKYITNSKVMDQLG